MSEHRIFLLENPARLSIDLGRLKIGRRQQAPVHVALDDIAVLVLHHQAISITHAALVALAEHGAVVLSTDHKHLPAAVQIPLYNNVQLVSRLEAQISLRQSELPDKLWQQLIAARLSGQAFLLQQAQRGGVALLKRLAARVEPGDKANLESQGARHFWQHWLEKPHRRHKQQAEDNINACLNFGYAILRSCLARAVVAAGLHPALGIHHRSSENYFNLIDDLIEPYRYLVEERVRGQLLGRSLDGPAKQQLAQLVTATVVLAGREYRFPAAIQETVDSFVRVLEQGRQRLALPAFALR